jgi:catechol 2,3-dioxygenase-like lactoylglutathione lyase family enzyme
VIRTFGLTHVAVAVEEFDRASRFYRHRLGAVEVDRRDGFVQLQTPGTRDVLVFEANPKLAGKAGGIAHFGFRLQDPPDIDAAARRRRGRRRDQGAGRVRPQRLLVQQLG